MAQVAQGRVLTAVLQAQTLTQGQASVIRVAAVLVLVLAQQVRQVRTQAQAVRRLILGRTQPLIVAVAVVAVLRKIKQAAMAAQVVSSCVGSPQTQQGYQSHQQEPQQQEQTVLIHGLHGIPQVL